ncbi:MAG: ATP-grasp domain-containing protein [Oscillospiraceae bacterium]|nr:ATP-grasp domain-containing protein [Oscillospiraceae bacterium]
MNVLEARFVPALFGHDINVYSVARAFHEMYGVRSYVFCKAAGGPCRDSRIIAGLTCDPAMDTREVFLRNTLAFCGAHRDKTVFLLGCGDNYVRLLSANRESFPAHAVAPYMDLNTLESLIYKESFYRLCEKAGIDHPATVILRAGEQKTLKPPFGPPYILKPSNGVTYWEHPFPGQHKVFTLSSWEDTVRAADAVFGAGYDDSLILQEFIPGDDSRMRVLTCYSDRRAKVRMAALGHVLLEEHTPHGIGNHAVILNGSRPELTASLTGFLETLGISGFSNMDIKYDARDGRYKLFEINLRQGRSNYYVTAGGGNVAAWLVQDYVDNALPPGLVEITERRLWSVVPRGVLFRYIHADYHGEMKALIREGKSVNPLFYERDMSLKRRARLMVGLRRQGRNYQRHGTRIGR